MPYRIQTRQPDSGQFTNTTHESPDIRALKRLVEGEAFRSVRARIVNESGQVIFEAPGLDSTAEPTLKDLAAMLNVPIVDSPEKLFGGPGDKKR